MNDRSIQMALLVVVVVALAAIALSLARHPNPANVPLMATAVGLLTSVVGVLTALALRQNGGDSSKH